MPITINLSIDQADVAFRKASGRNFTEKLRNAAQATGVSPSTIDRYLRGRSVFFDSFPRDGRGGRSTAVAVVEDAAPAYIVSNDKLETILTAAKHVGVKSATVTGKKVVLKF